MAPISDAVREQLISGNLSLLEKRLYCHEEEIDHWELPIRAACSSEVMFADVYSPLESKNNRAERAQTLIDILADEQNSGPQEGSLGFELYPTTPTEMTTE